ncbi:MAG TPA: CotH kinase family protein, partial [Usitatibacter sp.]|nr:CotH kinase family protein [Usitatibacter sp.]
MRASRRFLAGAALAALMPCVTLAAENYQGLWWNAAESGWGLNIAHQRDAMTATWLTYDASGRGTWLTMLADRRGDGTYAGTVYETTRPYFGVQYEPVRVSRLPVGQATLAFGDASHGTLQFNVRGVEGSKAITREVFGPVPECTYSAQPEMVNASNYTDLWWAAGGTQRNWSINFAHQGDVVFATWSTYDYFGAPLWLAATATRIAGNVYGGALIRTTGPAFGAAAFDPALVTRAEAGSATFTFSNGNAATFAYTMDGVKRTLALSRELFAPPAGTRCRNEAAAAIEGRVFEGAGVAATVCADTNGNGLCDADEPKAATDAAGAYSLVAAGYTGPLVAETSAGYRMVSPGRDYSANITPYTTLVALTGERDFAIAEMMVRNELGLPQRFRIRLDQPPAEGSLVQSVARHAAAALQAASTGLADAGAFARVIAAFPPALTDLPQLFITTKDGAPIESKEVYVDATFALVNPAAASTTVNLAGKIRGRGNFTWLQAKKPYKVQLANDAAYAALADVLGMTKNRNWALLADHVDLALMRNQLVFTLGNSSLFNEGLKWTPAMVRLEVWLNGRFDGLYSLTEDVRVDAARLNIGRIGANDLDGGYLVEVDVPLDCYNDGTLSLQHVTPQGVHVCIKTPDESAATLAQVKWIDEYVDAAEGDLYIYDTVDRLNLVSYVDWYLVNEYIRNWDGPFYSSDYMWKDKASAAVPADRLLNMGPLWDFDISAGNANEQDRPQGCWIARMREQIPNWYTKLAGNREFVDLVVARWKDKQAALGRL